jgi:hypothetical protein
MGAPSISLGTLTDQLDSRTQAADLRPLVVSADHQLHVSAEICRREDERIGGSQPGGPVRVSPPGMGSLESGSVLGDFRVEAEHGDAEVDRELPDHRLVSVPQMGAVEKLGPRDSRDGKAQPRPHRGLDRLGGFRMQPVVGIEVSDDRRAVEDG